MPDPPPYPGAPRWVKVSGLIALVLVLLVGIIVLTGIAGEHGPGRHLPSSDTPPTSFRGDPPRPSALLLVPHRA
jgi:hypothetical protein